MALRVNKGPIKAAILAIIIVTSTFKTAER